MGYLRLSLIVGVLALAPASMAQGTGPITFESLLKEMVDRTAITRFPDPAYVCKQFSSYDRKSTSPDDQATWFANNDANQYLRVEEVAAGPADGSGAAGPRRKEWVMADMDGPGAVVRIWSANPRGNLRIYLDGASTPALEGLMTDLLGAKGRIDKPLSQEVSRGWNLYLPIPYAKHCKITSDQDGFYYQVNYRTYDPGARVETFSTRSLDAADAVVRQTQQTLAYPGFLAEDNGQAKYTAIEPGKSGTIIDAARGPGAIGNLIVWLKAKDLAAALRSTVLVGEFDGQQTIWCPVGDFFGAPSGPVDFEDWYVAAHGGRMQSQFVMPYAKSVKLTLLNLGKEPVEFARTCMTLRGDDTWTPSSMHFHAAWHSEYPIHAYGGRGTKDWNYLEADGKGVYVGDSLSVMNPVPDWWGEGDEKIYVDGEKFPSHFGTGTEDYYGYAWCCPVPFQHPFHAQPRADGHSHRDNNWGYTTVTRVRSLDAIPFTKHFKFDMEIWHWKECDEAYGATTYFYAMPGATTNRKPQPEEASKPLPVPTPLPPPFKIEGAIECEDLKIVGQSDGLTVIRQDMLPFAPSKWSGETQLWIQGRQPGDFVELEIPTGSGPEANKPMNVVLYPTRSWDYGVVQFSVNGQEADEPEDLYSGERGKAVPAGPTHLGIFKPKHGKLILRAEVVRGNPKADGTKSFFGLDCVVITPAPPEQKE